MGFRFGFVMLLSLMFSALSTGEWVKGAPVQLGNGGGKLLDMDTDFELGASSKTLYFDTNFEDAVQWPNDHGEIEGDTVLTIGGERAPSDENTEMSWWHWNQPTACEYLGGQVCTYGGDECSLVRREGEYLFNQWHDSRGVNRMTTCSRNSGQGVHAVTSAALKCGLTTLVIQTSGNHTQFPDIYLIKEGRTGTRFLENDGVSNWGGFPMNNIRTDYFGASEFLNNLKIHGRSWKNKYGPYLSTSCGNFYYKIQPRLRSVVEGGNAKKQLFLDIRSDTNLKNAFYSRGGQCRNIESRKSSLTTLYDSKNPSLIDHYASKYSEVERCSQEACESLQMVTGTNQLQSYVSAKCPNGETHCPDAVQFVNLHPISRTVDTIQSCAMLCASNPQDCEFFVFRGNATRFNCDIGRGNILPATPHKTYCIVSERKNLNVECPKGFQLRKADTVCTELELQKEFHAEMHKDRTLPPKSTYYKLHYFRIGPEISTFHGVEQAQCGKDCSADKSCYAFQYRPLDKWCVNLKYPKSLESLKKTQVNDIKEGGQIQDGNCPGFQYCIKTAANAATL